MNNLSLIQDGLQLMFIGMSMVLVFLSILVFCLNLMQIFFAEDPLGNNPPQKTAPVSDAEIAAISSALHRYRQKYQKADSKDHS